MNTDTLLIDIISLAHKAGAEVVQLRELGLSEWRKQDDSPATNADLIAESLIKDGLRSKGYCFKFTGEESVTECKSSEDCEIVADGIDGTRNFRDRNYGWCTSVAVICGGETVIGVVHDSHCDETYYATRGKGAFMQHANLKKRLQIPSILPKDFSSSIGSFRVAGSTSTKHQIIEDIKKLGGRGREWGCVALSICAVARGGLGVFIQSNSHGHDHIAAILIAQESGAHVSLYRHGGNPNADVVVSHPSISKQVNDIFLRRTTETISQ